jgi:hypothetical protein
MVGKTVLKVQAPIDTRVKPDEEIRLGVQPSLVRWLDQASGEALS